MTTAEMAMDGKDVRPYFTTPNEEILCVWWVKNIEITRLEEEKLWYFKATHL